MGKRYIIFSFVILFIGFGCKEKSREEKVKELTETIRLQDSLAMEAMEYSPSSNYIKYDSIVKSVSQNYSEGDIKIIFPKFKRSSTFIFDRYGDEYRYRPAERDEIFVTADITINSSSKYPDLPCIYLVSYRDSVLRRIANLDYRFYRWSDYGSYLGNYNDPENDFAYSAKVRFSIGTSVAKRDIEDDHVFIVVSKKGSLTRKNEEFDSPAVSYEGSCSYFQIINASTFKDYIVVSQLK